jgi:hypothetical protein
MTYYYWRLITTGPLREHFHQLIGRVDFTLRIPEGKVFRAEIEAACKAFCPQPDPLMLKQAAIAAQVGEGRLRALFKALKTAANHAKRMNQPFCGKHLQAVVDWRNRGGVWLDDDGNPLDSLDTGINE